MHFLSFCNFNFQLAQMALQFLVLKVPRNLSNNSQLLSKDYKLRNIVGAHAFNSVLDTSAPWAGKLNGVYLPPLLVLNSVNGCFEHF